MLTSDQNEKMHFDNSMHGARAAFGLTAVTGHGGFFNICDDPHERDDWKRPNELKRNIDAYEANVYQAVTDPIEARRLVIGQRVADNDLSGHLVRQGGWDTLIIPTEYDPKRSKVTVIGWKDPRTEQGELACPARWGPKEVAVVKRATRLFMAFHQQSPTSDEGKIFPRNKWKYYKEDPREVVHRMETVIISVDCSFKDTPNSSMVAMLVIGKIGAYKFILDRRTDLMDMVATLRNLRALAQLWPQARAKIVEKYANGPAVVNQLRDEIPGMIEWPPEGQRKDSKIACAQVIQPEHESGNLCLPDPDVFPWVSEFVEICAAFPDGDYDDDVDALSQGVMRLDRTPTMAPPQGVGRSAAWLR